MTHRPHIEHCSGFRTRNEELKCSGVSGSEGENSPLRDARPKLTSHSDSPYRKPPSTHFLVPTGIFGRIYRTEQYFGPGRGCCSGWKPLTVVMQKCQRKRLGERVVSEVSTKQNVYRNRQYSNCIRSDSIDHSVAPGVREDIFRAPSDMLVSSSFDLYTELSAS